ncbi:hypothetical protein NEOLI_004777 [Neolecta irregularis DAH-3]|uniref:Uncharacterized protein n=1 Tax=Neolecta irregularis (strain DAH-3) TaxID=1198029 RepID=A0A1U7LR31_NEOID|nr:hypothetical protein NEOLI_004777 [Neolecta irregularis DAH-3]|eukprot:OLL25130.1 hypothetical protein NEOLI_004777 [Neolecta irregularis DAH-3]
MHVGTFFSKESTWSGTKVLEFLFEVVIEKGGDQGGGAGFCVFFKGPAGGRGVYAHGVDVQGLLEAGDDDVEVGGAVEAGGMGKQCCEIGLDDGFEEAVKEEREGVEPGMMATCLAVSLTARSTKSSMGCSDSRSSELRRLVTPARGGACQAEQRVEAVESVQWAGLKKDLCNGLAAVEIDEDVAAFVGAAVRVRWRASTHTR